jgi:hypothetical protein
MGDLLEWLLKKENKSSCRFVGIILVIPCVAYCFSGGFPQGVNDDAMIFSHEWFREILLISLAIMCLFGLILMAFGFSKSKNDE